jgi:N-methylhydantoinase A/oxoprolinase/acetone carboxylase beta subunit
MEEGPGRMRYMLGIDVGGTFTDFVAYDRDGFESSQCHRRSAPSAFKGTLVKP